MEFIFRSAIEDDIIPILQLNIEIHDVSYREFQSSEFVSHRINKYQKRIQDLQYRHILEPKEIRLLNSTIVATTVSNMIIGYITIYPTLFGELIEWLYVKPKFQGCGLGKKLIGQIDNDQQFLIVDVHSDNQSARNFYQRLGFEYVSPNHLNYPRVIMRKCPAGR